MAATWRGALSFGLLSIPIRLYPAARSQPTYLHQLHKKCHTRLKQRLFCPTCNRIVKGNEVVKGYEMYFQNEIREVAGYGEKPKSLHLKPQEIKLAEQLIETLSEDFNPAKYHDTYQERLRALVEAKQQRKTLTEQPIPRQAQVIDIMDALKKSLRETERTGKRRRVSEHAAASRDGRRLVS